MVISISVMRKEDLMHRQGEGEKGNLLTTIYNSTVYVSASDTSYLDALSSDPKSSDNLFLENSGGVSCITGLSTLSGSNNKFFPNSAT